MFALTCGSALAADVDIRQAKAFIITHRVLNVENQMDTLYMTLHDDKRPSDIATCPFIVNGIIHQADITITAKRGV